MTTDCWALYRKLVTCPVASRRNCDSNNLNEKTVFTLSKVCQSLIWFWQLRLSLFSCLFCFLLYYVYWKIHFWFLQCRLVAGLAKLQKSCTLFVPGTEARWSHFCFVFEFSQGMRLDLDWPGYETKNKTVCPLGHAWMGIQQSSPKHSNANLHSFCQT